MEKVLRYRSRTPLSTRDAKDVSFVQQADNGTDCDSTLRRIPFVADLRFRLGFALIRLATVDLSNPQRIAVGKG